MFPGSIKMFVESSARHPSAVARSLATLVRRPDLPHTPLWVRVEDTLLQGPWDLARHLSHLERMFDPQHPERRDGIVIRVEEQTRQVIIRGRGGRLFSHDLDRVSDRGFYGRLAGSVRRRRLTPIPVTFIPFEEDGRWLAGYLMRSVPSRRPRRQTRARP